MSLDSERHDELIRLRVDNARLSALVDEQRAARGEAEAERDDAESQNEALHVKLHSLAPHGTCACSYDKPDDVCSHHSPALRAAEATITRLRDEHAAVEARLREALEPFADAWEQCLAIGEQGGGYVQDDERAWISGNAGGTSYTMFKFGDLRRAKAALTKEPTDG